MSSIKITIVPMPINNKIFFKHTLKIPENQNLNKYCLGVKTKSALNMLKKSSPINENASARARVNSNSTNNHGHIRGTYVNELYSRHANTIKNVLKSLLICRKPCLV